MRFCLQTTGIQTPPSIPNFKMWDWRILFGDHCFKNPLSHTNGTKSILEYVEELKNYILFQKGKIEKVESFWDFFN